LEDLEDLNRTEERRRREVEEELTAVQKELDRLKRGECRIRGQGIQRTELLTGEKN